MCAYLYYVDNLATYSSVAVFHCDCIANKISQFVWCTANYLSSWMDEEVAIIKEGYRGI